MGLVVLFPRKIECVSGYDRREQSSFPVIHKDGWHKFENNMDRESNLFNYNLKHYDNVNLF